MADHPEGPIRVALIGYGLAGVVLLGAGIQRLNRITPDPLGGAANHLEPQERDRSRTSELA